MSDKTETARLVKRLRDAYADVDHVPPYAASLAGDAADAIERLAAENAELRKDAERYRWLRDDKRLKEAAHDDGENRYGMLFIGTTADHRWGFSGDSADVAIDAAMAEGKGDE